MASVPPPTETPNDHQERVRRLRAEQAEARMQPDVRLLLPPSTYRKPPFSLRKFLICVLLAVCLALLVATVMDHQIAHVTTHQQQLLDDERQRTGETSPVPAAQPAPAAPVQVLIIDDWATSP